MKTSYWIGIALTLMTAALRADQSPAPIPAPVETGNRVDTTTQDPEAAFEPAPARETQKTPPPEPVKRFVPKERIPADSAISFPSDI